MSSTTTAGPVTQTETAATVAAADRALLIVRLAVAVPFIFHGAQLALGAFGGAGLAGFVQASGGKVPLPVAALVAYGEFLGGLGVLFGVLTRLAGASILLIMLGAILIVHLPHGYDVTKGGFEYPLTHVFLTLALLVAGPGALSAWGLIGRPRPAAPILQ